jgi:hypothetical protein
MMHEELVTTNPKVAEAVATLEAAYPGKRIKAVETAAGIVVMRSATRQEYVLFNVWLQDEDKSNVATAQERLMRSIVVSPGPDVFDQWLSSYPGISQDPEVSKTLRILLGMTKDAAAKKDASSVTSSAQTTPSPSIAGPSSSGA